MQYRALEEMKSMALKYGFDISKPAKNAFEAIEWTYLAYLAAVKENNGAAMSLGRVDAFFDIYINRDIEEGILTEEDAQELIDQFVIKLRLVRHLRTPDYDELFSGDPTWVTCSIGGVSESGKSMVTKTSYRIIHTLTNLLSRSNASAEALRLLLFPKKLPIAEMAATPMPPITVPRPGEIEEPRAAPEAAPEPILAIINYFED